MNGENYSLLTYRASWIGNICTVVGNAEELRLISQWLEYLFKLVPNTFGKPKFKPMSNGVVKILNTIETKQELHNFEEIISGSNASVDRNQRI